MKKKANSVFKFILLTLLFIFIVIFYADRNGYYTYSNYRMNVMTEEGITKFEEDVSNGKPIDINNYIEKGKDYSNNISNAGVYLSDLVSHYLRKGIVKVFETITNNIE